MKEKPFNDAFAALKALQKKEEKPQAPAKKAPPPAPKKPAAAPVEDERMLFLQSVGAVDPLRGPAKVSGQKAPPSPPPMRPEEDDVLTQLSELVAGEGPFEIADSVERIEGNVAGLDRRIVQKLKRGDYPVEARVDLHGLTRSEAEVELERFVLQARRGGKRCVLVVTGRGLNSPDQISVLRESVQSWLSRGRLSKIVLAFSSARPQDGGVGAVYVLLRR